MKLNWLGTAGFWIKSPEGEILFDPFLSRGRTAARSPYKPDDFGNVEHIFLGHGHFDHAFDVPAILQKTDADVFAPGLTGQLLRVRGAPPERIRKTVTDEFLFEPLKVRAFKSDHVHFDKDLVVSTAQRCGLKHCAEVIGLGVSYPKGLVQTYLFEEKGKKFLFVSSAGCSPDELKKYRDLEVDVLLAPLQGHTHIQKIAAEMTSIVAPKMVIPHHHDDFYPPMSQEISLGLFKEELKKHGFKGDYLEIPLFSEIQL